MKRIFLIGAGGHAKSCIDVIERQGEYRIEGLIDKRDRIGETLLGYPILADDDNIDSLISDENYFLITIGQIKSSLRREELFKLLLSKNAKFASVVSPDAYVSKHAEIGIGTVVMAGAIVTAGARIGRNCIINTRAILEHDVVVGDNSHISTGAIVNGGSEIGECSFVGSNSTVVQGVSIPKRSFIKAGSLAK